MNAQQIADRIVNKSGSYQEVMNYAEGMISPLIQRAEASEDDNTGLRSTLRDEILRAETAEARAAQAEEDAADLLIAYRQQKEIIVQVESERDEAQRQLAEAQMAIDVLSQTIVAQNNESKRLSQQREDVAEYRAEIARIIAELKQTRGALEIIKNTMAVGRNVGEDKEQAYQDAEEIVDFALNNPLMHQAATA